MKRKLVRCVSAFVAAAAIPLATPTPAFAQIAPGPHEILPFQDGFIVEAFFDLYTNSTSIADWSGYSGSSWVSPDAYNNHIGTDVSVQTGTPVFATCNGTVVEAVNGFPVNDHTTYYGNFVHIAVDAPAPNGEAIDCRYAHMLQVVATVGQRVAPGDFLGLSDNTGNSTTEHVHFQSEFRSDQRQLCPFYWGHFKYPIVMNQSGTFQLGRVVRVTAPSTPIRSSNLDSASQITTAYSNQLYFCSFPKRGYYQVFIPANTSWRSGWIRSTAVEEVMTGTVIQPLPDPGLYNHTAQLTNKFSIRATPSDTGTQLGQIVFGGGRFVADQITNGFYRIPLPGAAATWGWVKATNRMIVYPQLYNPSVPLLDHSLPVTENFTTVGTNYFGRPKFNHAMVKAFSPAAPGGDGNALFITDKTNFGQGTSDSISVGMQTHTNYFVQCAVYFNYRPSYVTGKKETESYGLFLRDDGWAGLDTTFEGSGNSYTMYYDAYSGRLYGGKFVNGSLTDLLPSTQTITASGWHTLRMEAQGSQIKYFLDGVLLATVTDTTFHSGLCGIGYNQHFSTNPAARGAYFDNFSAGLLP